MFLSTEQKEMQTKSIQQIGGQPYLVFISQISLKQPEIFDLLQKPNWCFQHVQGKKKKNLFFVWGKKLHANLVAKMQSVWATGNILVSFLALSLNILKHSSNWDLEIYFSKVAQGLGALRYQQVCLYFLEHCFQFCLNILKIVTHLWIHHKMYQE